MFSSHTTEEFKKATITGYFGFTFEENSVRKTTWLPWRHNFRKALFSKWFPFTRKPKPGVFKFFLFEELFWKAPFSRRISINGKLRFSTASGVVCIGSELLHFFVLFLSFSLDWEDISNTRGSVSPQFQTSQTPSKLHYCTSNIQLCLSVLEMC